MANPCFYTYKGKRYTYEEFATLLHDGELHNLANEGIVQGDFVNSMPKELKIKQKANDFDVILPENKENIVVADSSNGFILVDSESKKPIEIFNEKAGENEGISKFYDTKEKAESRLDELKNETQTQGNTEPNENIRPTTEQVGEVAVTEKPTSEVAKTPSMESATQPKPSEGVVEGEPLKENQFFKKYKAVHKDIRSKGESEQLATAKKIKEEGLNEGFNVNALPLYKGAEKGTDVTSDWYKYKKGDIVYILPKEGYKDGPNGYMTKKGYIPSDAEIVKIQYDGQSVYDAYKNQFKPTSEVAKTPSVESAVEPKPSEENFKLDNKEKFYHASPNKRKGRLELSNAPQFGTGVYFSTNKEIVENEFGNENTTEVSLKIQNPVYTNTKEWNSVEKLAVEKAVKDYNERKGLKEDDMGYKNDWDISEIPSKFISDSAKELGYDSIIDKGSHDYENEIVVLDESKINYPEDNVAKPETRKEARIKIADAKIDDFANALKDLLPKGADLSGLKKQGLSQDDIIDIIAKGAKELAKTSIEIDEAIRQVISKLKEHFEDLNVDEKAVMEKHFAEEEPIIADGEKYYSLKKSFVDAEREAKGKEELHGIVADERKQAEVQQDIKKRIDNGEIKQQEIDDLMQALAVNDVDFRTRFNTREQNAIMLHEQARLDKKEFEIISSLKTIPENTKEYSDAVFELARTQILADQNQQAIKNTGREAGKNLADRKGFVDGDFTRPGIIKMLEEVSKDKEVSKEQREEASKMAQQIKELQSKIDDYETRFKQHDEEVKKLEQQKAELEEKTAKTRAEEKFEKLQNLNKNTAVKKEREKVIRKTASEAFREKWKKINGNTLNAGINPQMLELVPYINTIAKSHIRDGVTDLNTLIQKIMIDLDVPEIDEITVRNLFSGYGLATKERKVSPDESTARELKSQQRALLALRDVEELGIAPSKTGHIKKEASEEVKRIRKEVFRAMREKGIDISKSKNPEDLWKTALEAYKTKINNRIEYLENIAKTENVEKFLKDKKKTKLKLDEEAKELKKKQQQIKNKVYNMAAKADFDTWSKLRKASHYAGRYMKGVLISHPVTIVKILASVAWRSAYKVPQAVSMYGASKLSKLVGSDIHKVQGINSAKDLKDHISDYYREQYSRENLRAFKETFLNHKSAEDILLGKHYAEVELPKIRGNKNLNPAQKMFFAHLYFLENISASSHGATKNLASLPEQKAWRNTILRNLIKEGIPESMMQDGSAIVIADQLGFLKGQRARFMQDNMLASQKSALTSYLSNKDMAIAGDIIDMAFPILKIGSNYVGESLEKMPGVGLVPHAVRKLSMKKGQVFNEKQKADLLRALSNQGVGMFSLLAGAMLYQNINPFYGTNAEDYAKKHGKKLPEDEEAIWKLDGVFTHSPDAVMMKAGAQMMWYWDMYDRAHPGENMSNAMMAILNWETTASIINQSPYISSTENTVSPLLKGEGIGKSMANNLRSRVPFGDFTKTIAEGKLPIFNKLAPKTGDELAKKLGLHPEEVKPSELKIYPKGFADNILIGLPGWREDVLKRLYDEEYGTGKMIKDIDKMIEERQNRGEKEIKKQKFLKGLNE